MSRVDEGVGLTWGDDMTSETTGTATSRATTAKRAQRRAGRARLAITGPSGAGKTWTALSVARDLTGNGRVVLIDTEPGDAGQTASTYYADAFAFDVIEWRPPFDPRDLTLTLDELGRSGEYAACIIDSASHFWTGEGGTLDIADGRFSGWKEATPVQQDFVDSILRSPMHMIVCTRAKQAYEVTQVERNGRTVQEVVKLGLQPIQRADLEYEFQVVATIDQQHRIDIGKTRCQPLAGKSFNANHQDDFAAIYAAWLDAGEPMVDTSEVERIRDFVGGAGNRAELARGFKSLFGSPDFLTVAQLDAAWLWLREHFVEPDAAAAATQPEQQQLDGGAVSVPETPEASSSAADSPDDQRASQGHTGPRMGTLLDVAAIVAVDEGLSADERRARLVELCSSAALVDLTAALEECELAVSGSRAVKVTRLVNHVLGDDTAAA